MKEHSPQLLSPSCYLSPEAMAVLFDRMTRDKFDLAQPKKIHKAARD